jgi:DNA (cytosine-5)-methyltransferase 1
MKSFTYIDLFCGCGGFSFGMDRAGLKCLAAIDFNSEAITVFKKNLSHVPHILEKDLVQFGASELSQLISGESVDVIRLFPWIR